MKDDCFVNHLVWINEIHIESTNKTTLDSVLALGPSITGSGVA